jgi:hypothetical protein
VMTAKCSQASAQEVALIALLGNTAP